MVQGRSGLGFTLEAAESLLIFGYFIRQELKGYEAIEFNILGLVDDPHAATAEFFEDPVVRNGMGDYRPESYVAETLEVNKADKL